MDAAPRHQSVAVVVDRPIGMNSIENNAERPYDVFRVARFFCIPFRLSVLFVKCCCRRTLPILISSPLTPQAFFIKHETPTDRNATRQKLVGQ